MEAETIEKAKRRWQRFEVEVQVGISLVRKTRQLNYSGMAHNISEGGMALFSVNELLEGEAITLEFALPYGRRLSLNGIIRNRDRFEYGVEFVRPSAADREELMRTCRALSLIR